MNSQYRSEVVRLPRVTRRRSRVAGVFQLYLFGPHDRVGAPRPRPGAPDQPRDDARPGLNATANNTMITADITAGTTQMARQSWEPSALA
jgi:hypothetical protein